MNIPVATVPLCDAASVYSGGTPSKSNASYWVGGIPWVSPKDMGNEKISDAEDHISQDAINSSATKLVPAGSILVVVRSGILVRRLPVALTTRPVAFNQDIKAVVVDETRFLPEFIFWILRASEQRVLSLGGDKFICPLPPIVMNILFRCYDATGQTHSDPDRTSAEPVRIAW
jgi:hypothetical protein